MVRPAFVSLLLAVLLAAVQAGAEPADPSPSLETEAAALDPRKAAREGRVGRQRLGARERALIRRPDRRRPDEQLSVEVFGRPLAIAGRYQISGEYEGDRLLDFDFLDVDPDTGVPDDFADGKVPLEDRVQLDQELSIDLFYPFTESISGYLEGQVNWNNRLHASFEGSFDEWFATFKEAWLYVADIGGSPVSLQVGRQRMADEREWWWDENHDVIRLHADGERFHAELGAMQRVMPIRTGEPYRVDPEEEDLLRVFGSTMYEWAPRQRVTVRALYQHDYSWGHVQLPPEFVCVRDLVPRDGQPDGVFREFFERGCIGKEDESDADLFWIGVSADGRLKPDALGGSRIYYWLETAFVTGEEEFTRFRGASFERSVSTVTTTSVRGVGVDVGATWQGDGAGEPNVTLGYAYGSGRKGTAKGNDGGFRQTGIQDNSDKFRGVTSLRYYGFLLDPELSNMHIFTLGGGLRFLEESSVDLIYHYYRQDVASELLRDVSFKRDPTGLDTDLGHELDLVVGVEDFDPLEVRLVGSVFRMGDAFGPKSGGFSYLAALRMRLNF